jgi:hypothetical protein
LIHQGGDADGVRYLFAGDKSGGDALADAGALGDAAKGTVLGQGDEGLPQHGGPDCRGFGLPETVIGMTAALQYFLPQTGSRGSIAKP